MQDLVQVVAGGLLMGGIYAMVSVGLSLIFGVVRLVNFAHGEFVMIAMYASYVLKIWLGLDPYLSVILVIPGLFLAGLVVQRLVLQPLLKDHSMQVFATFGLLILLENTAFTLTGGQFLSFDTAYSRISLQVGPVSLHLPAVIAFLASVAVTVGLPLWLNRSALGRAIRAVSQDQQAARLMGIHVERVYLIAFGIGSACAGLAGALLVPMYVISPKVGSDFVLAAFAVVVLGGLGSVPGAFVGGLLVGVVESLAGFLISPAVKESIWFLIFILVLMARPQGLFGIRGAEEVGFK